MFADQDAFDAFGLMRYEADAMVIQIESQPPVNPVIVDGFCPTSFYESQTGATDKITELNEAATYLNFL